MSRAFRLISRTKARKRATDAAFEADQHDMGCDSGVLRDLLRQRRVITAAEAPLPKYSIQIIEGVMDDLRRIDDLIAAHARVLGLDHIAAVDPAVMYVVVWEMFENSEDVSTIIAIDEAISVVESLPTNAAPNFVNAVLDAICKDLETPAWTRHKISVVEDGPVPDPKDGPTLDLKDEGKEPTEEYNDTEDALLSPELAEPGKEGPTDELSDEEFAEPDEFLDGH